MEKIMVWIDVYFFKAVKSGCILLVVMQREGNGLVEQEVSCGQGKEFFILSIA